MLPFLNNLFSGPQVGEDGTYTSGVYKGMTEKTAGALNAGVGLVSGIAGNLLSNGMSTGVGDTLQSLSGVASAIPGVGTLVGAGLNVVGGLVNGAFGSKLNAQGIANAQQDIAKLNNFNANAGSFDEFTALTGPQAQGFSQSDIGKDGWFSSKAKRKYNELKAQQAAALARAQASMQNNASNLVNDNNLSLMSNLAAFGGPLHSYGTDWTNGLTIVGSGGTHEQNPYEGVPMGIAEDGQPNLVEEGEAIYNDYVFSKRIKVPKAVRQKYKLRGPQEMTFADAAKYAQKESEERPNDPISQRGLQDIMNKLMIEQESIRQKRQERKMQRQYSEGGGIHIAPSKRGTFTAAASKHNMGVQEFASKVLANPEDYSPAMRKKANFARNASKWKHAYGGPMGILYEGDGPIANILGQVKSHIYDMVSNPAYSGIMEKSPWGASLPTPYFTPSSTTPSFTGTEVADGVLQSIADQRGGGTEAADIDVSEVPVPYRVTTFTTNNPNYGTFQGKKDTRVTTGRGGVVVGGQPTQPKIDPLSKLRFVPALGGAVGVFSDLMGWTNRPDYRDANAVLSAMSEYDTPNTVKFNPIGDYLRYTPLDRMFYANQLGAQAGAARRNILNTSGGNRGAAMAGLLASDYNAQTQLGNLYRQAEEYNLGQREKVAKFNQSTNMFNSEGDLKAQTTNAELRNRRTNLMLDAAYRAAMLRNAADDRASQARALNLTNLFNSVGDIGREAFAMDMIRNSPALLYDWMGRYKGRILDEADGTSSSKRAKGGHLTRKRR